MSHDVASLPPRHAMALRQGTLFTIALEELEAATRVSRDEMRRWQDRGLLSFDPLAVERFDERHRIEIEFVNGLVRCGLPDAWIGRLLENLPKPYCYDPNCTFYSFVHGRWVTLPPAPPPEEVVQGYLDDLAGAEDWATLHEIQERVAELLESEAEDTHDAE